MKLSWPWKRRPQASLSLLEVEALHPLAAEAFRAQGREAETQRIRAVYRAAALVELGPLLEGALFDGKTTPGEAAVLQVAALQAAAKEAERRACSARNGATAAPAPERGATLH